MQHATLALKQRYVSGHENQQINPFPIFIEFLKDYVFT